jgi:hypothetical protein
MMNPLTPTQLRRDLYKLLDQVIETGTPLEIRRNQHLLRIVPVESVDRLAGLVPRPDVIVGDPEALVHLEWETDVSLP